VAFGGAGPLHACELAGVLRIPRVLVPATPGVLSALGMLAADVVKDYVQTVMTGSDTADAIVGPLFEQLGQRGTNDLREEEIAAERIVIERYLDLRYAGQSYELVVPFTTNAAAADAAFHDAHLQRFGYSAPGERVEVVNVRVKARGRAAPPSLPRAEPVVSAAPTPALIRPVTFDAGAEALTHDTPVYDRSSLLPGMTIAGPAIVTQYDTTTVVPPGWRVQVDVAMNLVCEPK
jgi:N-methylhydantoinase A